MIKLLSVDISINVHYIGITYSGQKSKKRNSAKFTSQDESDAKPKASLKKTLPLPGMNDEEDIFEMYKQHETSFIINMVTYFI